MPVVFNQRTYTVPGIYQWTRPSLVPGSGPLGSTYTQTIVTVIGPGAGGASGSIANNPGVALQGGTGGGGGGYCQATFNGASLPLLQDIIVLPANLGGAPTHFPGGPFTGVAGNTSGALLCRWGTSGQLVQCGGGGSNAITGANGGSAVQVGAITAFTFNGCSSFDSIPVANPQPSTGPYVLGVGGNPSWSINGNNAGANGGSAFVFGSTGGGVNGLGGGKPQHIGTAPGAGGGGDASLTALFIQAGNGADAKNPGAGGGGGGAAVGFAGGVDIRGGAGGKSGPGLVQTTDIFQLPPAPPPYYFVIKLWFHMLNQSRPVSLTGRYKA